MIGLRTSKFCTLGNLAAVAVSVLFGASIASGQESADNAALSEIIVTARKVEEPLQSSPVAVTAISGEAMEQRGIISLEDLESIPGTTLSAAGLVPGYAVTSMRGLSMTGVEISLDPAVATIINGAFYARSTNGLVQMFDIESVEVLRGPQGTLYGRNSPAGVISIRSRRPGTERSLTADASLGNLGTTDFRFAADLPIGDRLSSRLAVMKRDSDGPYSNQTPGAEDPDQVDLLLGRLSLDLQASDNLYARFTIESFRNKGTGGNAKDVSIPGEHSITWILPLLVPGAVSPDPDPNVRNIQSNLVEIEERDGVSTILEFDYTIGDHTWTSNSAYFEETNEFSFDVDATRAQLLHAFQTWKSEQFSQELRVASNKDGRFNFILGAYFLDEKWSNRQNSFLNRGMVTGAPPLAGFVNNNQAASNNETSALAVFGQAYFDLSDSVRLTLGGRYSEDDKDFRFSFISGVRRAGIPPGTIVDASESFDNFSPLVSIDWQSTENVMTYLSWSNGYRAGGFNGRARNLITVQTPYDEEEAQAIEWGIKSELMNRRVRMNLAVHYTEYTDQQMVADKVVNDEISTFVLNAASSTTAGIELEVTAAISPNLSLGATAAFQDASYDSFIADLTGDGIETDNSDLEIPRTPERMVSLSVTYTPDIGLRGILALGADWTYTSAQELQTVQVAGLTSRSATHLLSAFAEWQINDNVAIKVFGRNLTDEVYPGDAGNNPGWGAYRNHALPRTYGAGITLDF